MDPSLPPVDTWSYLSIAQQFGSNIWHDSKQKERERSKSPGLSSRNTVNIQWLIPFGYYFHINLFQRDRINMSFI
jgi:hypothetical protein